MYNKLDGEPRIFALASLTMIFMVSINAPPLAGLGIKKIMVNEAKLNNPLAAGLRAR